MQDGERADGVGAGDQRRADPWWILPGTLLVLTAALVLARSWEPMLANHPAYPVTTLVALLVGLTLIALGVRRPPRRSGTGPLLLRIGSASVLVGGAALLWWLQPLPAEAVALEALEGGSGVVVEERRSSVILSPSGEAKAGLVLYPGARVDPRAYAALGSRLAVRGFRVVLVKCPYDLALLCRGDGAGYTDASVPWMIGGHSLGGPVAVRDAATDRRYQGLLLWASYPLDDVSERGDLVVASISGTQDAFTTVDDVSSSASLLPTTTVFTAIEGAIHSHFGDYGIQPGDGVATTPRAEAQRRIIAATERAFRDLTNRASTTA
jgi:hypothetical protein